MSELIKNAYDDVESADRALDEVIATCDDLGIRCFLSSGTCLGFIRDGCYIDGDEDIDVRLICGPDDFKQFANTLVLCGFKHDGDRHFARYGITFHIARPLDWVKPYINSLQILSCRGRKYNVPSPVDAFLRVLYGDWKIPGSQKALKLV